MIANLADGDAITLSLNGGGLFAAVVIIIVVAIAAVISIN